MLLRRDCSTKTYLDQLFVIGGRLLRREVLLPDDRGVRSGRVLLGHDVRRLLGTAQRPLHSSRHHHASHRSLLEAVKSDDAPNGLVEAIFVPAARPVQSLRPAMRLASDIGCVLVVLCSRKVKADQVQALAAEMDAFVVAMDMDDVKNVLPVFETSEVVAGSRYERSTDLSLKRNLALMLSRIAGWERVFLLDDDIEDVEPSDVSAAAGLLDSFDAVGLKNMGYPDNSVVCHVYRQLGFKQDQFVGAGGLAIAPGRMRSFFPDIYNEDWLFLLGGARWLRVAETGKMYQRKFNPFADAERAQSEELGDCLAEGLYWLLDEGRPVIQADLTHWRHFLRQREQFIDGLLELLECEPEHNGDMISSLTAAKGPCEGLRADPILCHLYVHLWRSDLVRWRNFLSDVPTGLGLEKALVEMGWSGVARVQESTAAAVILYSA